MDTGRVLELLALTYDSGLALMSFILVVDYVGTWYWGGEQAPVPLLILFAVAWPMIPLMMLLAVVKKEVR